MESFPFFDRYPTGTIVKIVRSYASSGHVGRNKPAQFRQPYGKRTAGDALRLKRKFIEEGSFQLLSHS